MGDQTRFDPAGARISDNTIPIKKTATGITGLDTVLDGGLPEGRTTLIRGGSGDGKTMMGLECLVKNAKQGRSGIFISFEESETCLRENARSMGWNISRLETAGMLFLLDARLTPRSLRSGDFNLDSFFAIIEGKTAEMGARLIVLDALDVFFQVFDDPIRERDEIYHLKDWFEARNLTLIMTAKDNPDSHSPFQKAYLEFLSDCVIHLGHRVKNQIATRRLRVLKYRGSGFGSNEYPFVLKHGGLHVIPITTSRLGASTTAKKISSGCPRLDEITGGGYSSGSIILISGATGTGKTTLAGTFVQSARDRGEKTLYIDFEQTESSFVANMRSPGIDLQPAIEAGSLCHMSAIPEAYGAEVHLASAFDELNRFAPDHVIIDAISACIRMGDTHTAFEYVMRMVSACRQRNVTVILLNQASGFLQSGEISGIGISSLVDTLIFLRHLETGNQINRLLSIVKMRGRNHSNKYHELIISDQGVDIIETCALEGNIVTQAMMKTCQESMK